MEDGPGDPESPFHAGRERPDQVVPSFREADEREEVVDPLSRVVHAIEPCVVGKVGCGAHPVGEAVVLEEHPDPSARIVVDSEVPAEDPDLTRTGGEQTEQDPDGRGLSGPIRAEVAEDLPVPDGERDVAEDIATVE